VRDRKVPPEFEWIKPGVKAKCKIFKGIKTITRGPYWSVVWGWCAQAEDLKTSLFCSDLIPIDDNSSITLTLTREQEDQLLLCISAGLAFDKNFKLTLKMIPRKHFAPKDRGFMRFFRVRIVKSIKKQIEEKLSK